MFAGIMLFEGLLSAFAYRIDGQEDAVRIWAVMAIQVMLYFTVGQE